MSMTRHKGLDVYETLHEKFKDHTIVEGDSISVIFFDKDIPQGMFIELKDSKELVTYQLTVDEARTIAAELARNAQILDATE